MREQSATRQQLEASIRALLPSQADIDELTPSKNSAASIAGVEMCIRDRTSVAPFASASRTRSLIWSNVNK